MVERLGKRAINQKVAGSIPGSTIVLTNLIQHINQLIIRIRCAGSKTLQEDSSPGTGLKTLSICSTDTALGEAKAERPASQSHLCDHLGHPFRGHVPTQHRLPQVRVLHVLQVGDPAPHPVLVFHVSVLELVEDACRLVKELTSSSGNSTASTAPKAGYLFYIICINDIFS